MQCLEVIAHALTDPIVHPARRLSLLQRAHKLCKLSSQQNSENSRDNNSRKRRKLSVTVDTTAFKLSDFPEMDILLAPEVNYRIVLR